MHDKWCLLKNSHSVQSRMSCRWERMSVVMNISLNLLFCRFPCLFLWVLKWCVCVVICMCCWRWVVSWNDTGSHAYVYIYRKSWCHVIYAIYTLNRILVKSQGTWRNLQIQIFRDRCKLFHLYVTLLVLKLGYSGIARSISWLLIIWTGHWESLYGIYRINGFLSSKWIKNQIPAPSHCQEMMKNGNVYFILK